MGNQHVSYGVVRMHRLKKANKPPIKQFLHFHRFVFHAHKYSMHHAHLSIACKMHILTRFTRLFSSMVGGFVPTGSHALVCPSIQCLTMMLLLHSQLINTCSITRNGRFYPTQYCVPVGRIVFDVKTHAFTPLSQNSLVWITMHMDKLISTLTELHQSK